jgi:cysteine-rich repeat protein
MRIRHGDRLTLAAVVGLLLGAGACLDEATRCEDGTLCPSGNVCHLGTCTDGELVDACLGIAADGPCQLGGVGMGACVDGVCLVPVCGNGRLDDGEICDDGNLASGDGCRGDCRSDEVCGNGTLDPAEQCDLGDSNADTPDARCRTDCALARCGDGVIDPDAGEACDAGDNNSAAPDAACRPNCQPQRCADGVVDPGAGEVCDDGNLSPGDGCGYDCRSDETCGNGSVDFAIGERCDDGGLADHDGCSDTCDLQDGVWQRRPGAMAARYLASMVTDPARGGLFMYGGAEYSPAVGLIPKNETRAFQQTRWRLLRTTNGPSHRYGAALAYDAARREVVLLGGHRWLGHARGYLDLEWRDLA